MITLEKLAPFLAHSLKSVDWFDGKMLIRDVNLSNAINFVEGYTKAKILCRPFSDLTKPIKVEGYNEGKEFVPLEEIRRINWNRMRDVGRLNDVTIDKYEITTGSLPHWIIQLMYRWHFAVNLDPDDYIDINTI